MERSDSHCGNEAAAGALLYGFQEQVETSSLISGILPKVPLDEHGTANATQRERQAEIDDLMRLFAILFNNRRGLGVRR